MKRAAIVLGLPLVFVLAGHAPGAWACSCVGGLSQADYEEMAEHVFVGTATAKDDPDGGRKVVSSGRTIYWEFAVARVIKGEVDDAAVVQTSGGGASCGYDFRIGHRYRVYVSEDGDRMETGLCSGNEHLGADPDFREEDPPQEDPDTPVSNDDSQPEPDRAAAPPRAPKAEPAVDDVAEPRDEREVAAEQSVDTSAGGPGIAVGLAAVLAAVSGAGFLMTRRRRPA
jgi:hypothetical protein